MDARLESRDRGAPRHDRGASARARAIHASPCRVGSRYPSRVTASSGPPAANDATLLAKPGALGRATTSPGSLSCSVCGGSYPGTYRVCPSDGALLLGAGGGDDPMIGAVLAGTFRIVSRLGEGG